MTISLAIITKDRPHYLKRLLKTVSLQTIKPDEIIVIEDTSDNTFFNQQKIRELLHFDCKIHYESIQARSYARSRNLCLNLAQKDLLVFVDDDVLLPKRFLEYNKLFHTANNNTLGLVGKILPTSHKKIEILQSAVYMYKTRFYKKAKQILVYPSSAISFKTNKLKKLNLSFDDTLYTGEDFDFMMKIAEKKGVIYFDPNLKIFHSFIPQKMALLKRYIEFGKSRYLLSQRYPYLFNDYTLSLKRLILYWKHIDEDCKSFGLTREYWLYFLIINTGTYLGFMLEKLKRFSK